MARKDYKQNEKEFQQAQEQWEMNENNLEAWHKMFSLINLACFNNINKKLEKVIPKEEIEGKSLDITMNIMDLIKRKRQKKKEWKIQKVSSFVYLFCLSIYSKQLCFEEKVLGENAFINDETNDDYNQADYRYISGGGYIKID